MADIDLSKYMTTKKNGGNEHHVHYIKFERDKEDLESWEIEAYDVVDDLMSKGMKLDQIKFMIYDALLKDIGKEQGII